MPTGENPTQLERALHALRQMRTRLEAAEQSSREPLAVVGLSCRFPGAASPEAFWRLLRDGVDAITEVPSGRWDVDALYDPDSETPGKIASRWGGFVEGVELFDPHCFGISPREAAAMDPQQRILLEVVTEALERAGEPLDRLAGSATGMFVGAHSHSVDYALLQMRTLEQITTYTGTGTAHSILANRISYLFDLRGPSLAIDTACSSSLAAVHLACRSLRQRECDMALAAGVNLMLSPEATVMESRLRMMASDGRCKTFDARADGFVRGEGCGVIVLKRLRDALASGDPVLAVIAGSAMNQDGTTNGLTAPSGLAQREVIRQALADAHVAPESITFVETHGTGTSLGDPIEIEALSDELGRAGSAPCWLGAVKTNIGHLEGAAGIAGLIKAILAIAHRTIPPNLHLTQVNPHITLAGTRFELPDSAREWSAPGPLACGVSSFGWGGTNVHVVLRECLPAADETVVRGGESVPVRAVRLLPVSARSGEALRELAVAYGGAIEATVGRAGDVCHTAALRRTHFEHRLAVVASGTEEMVLALRAHASGQSGPELVSGRATPDVRRRLIYAFADRFPLDEAELRTLMANEPVFRARMEECDAVHTGLGGWPLLPTDAGESPEGKAATGFAVQVALCDLWRSWGMTADAMVGEGSGLLAAACAAGALELRDAIAMLATPASNAPFTSVITEPRLSLYSAATGRSLKAAELRAELLALMRAGSTSDTGTSVPVAGDLLEIGLDAILSPRLAASGGVDAFAAASSRDGETIERWLLRVLASLHVRGHEVNWEAFREPGARVLPLPTHPWRRERHWLSTLPEIGSGTLRSARSPLELRSLSSPALRAPVFEVFLTRESVAFLGRHLVGGSDVLPASFLATLILSAAAAATGARASGLEDLDIRTPATLGDGKEGGRIVQLILGAPVDGRISVEVHGRAAADESDWISHASARVLLRDGRAAAPDPVGTSSGDPIALPGRPQTLLPPALDQRLHPTVIDTALRAMADARPRREGEQPLVLASLGRLQLLHDDEDPVACHVGMPTPRDGGFVVDAQLVSAGGSTVAQLSGARFTPVRAASGTQTPVNEQLEYEIVWRARTPLSHAGAREDIVLPAPAELIDAARAEVVPPEQHSTAEATRDLCLALDYISACFAADALRQLGVDLAPGARLRREAVVRRSGATVHGAHLIEWMLDLLVADDVLTLAGDEWQVLTDAPSADAHALLDALRRRYPDHAAELSLLGRCGPQLANVVRGRVEPLELIFPGGALDDASRLYGDAPLTRASNLAVRDVVESVLAALPADRVLRVLELGAGTGGTTAHLLPILPPDRCEYVFTDVSRAFLERAQHRFASHPFVRYAQLDVEVEPGEQGFASGRFDLVIASNVLHATRDVCAGVQRASSLLSEKGVLLVCEGTAPSRWIDLVFGLVHGWWSHVGDGLRPDHALMDAARWQELLAREDMARVAVLELPSGVSGRTYSQAVIVASRSPVRRRQPAVRPKPALAHGSWLVFGDEGGTGRRIAASVRAAGQRCTLASAGEDSHAFGIDEQRLDARDAINIEQAAAAWKREAGAGGTVVYLWGTDDDATSGSGEEVQGRVLRHCANVAAIARAIHAEAESSRMWIVTRGAQAVRRGESADPVQATLWGIGRAIALEMPEVWGGLVDLGTGEDSGRNAEQVIEQIRQSDGEDQVAFRAGDRLIARLVPVAALRGGAPIVHGGGAYLVTGGMGTLGLKVARWLADHGAGQVTLLGRTALPEREQWDGLTNGAPAREQIEAILDIERTGCAVRYVAADVCDSLAMTTLMQRFGCDWPPLRGVFHAAAAVSFDAIAHLTSADLDRVMRPKIMGAWLLHELTRSLPLDHFVLFSSVASLWGARGMGHYAAANQFLDALAHHRRAHGLPALSVNWGGWAGGGGSREASRLLEQSDLLPLQSGRALALMGVMMDAGVPQRAVAAVRWQGIRAAYEAAGGRPLMSEIAAEESVAAEHADVVMPRSESALLTELRGLAEKEARHGLTRHVREQVAQVLSLPVERLMEPGQGFFRLGMDSLTTVELRARLEHSLGVRLPTTIAFEYPTVEALSAHLADRVLAVGSGSRQEGILEAGETDADPTFQTMSDDELAALLDAAISNSLRDGSPVR